MAQRRLVMTRGGYYHIYNRGANRTSIFRCDDNYRYMLGLLQRYCPQLHVTMIAYCLMPNHFHWLVRQDEDVSAGLLPQRVCKAYSNAFNNYYQHNGTLFEGTYKVIAVSTDAYLYHVCRYIHANPVRHGFAIDPALWPYSNYQEWIGQRHESLVDNDFIAHHFPISNSYKAYVTAYLRHEVAPPHGLEQYMSALDE
jgi:REP element-mobilizing transposase RayT